MKVQLFFKYSDSKPDVQSSYIKNDLYLLFQKQYQHIIIAMEVENNSFFFPGQVISEQKIQYNSTNLYQNGKQQICTLKFGQPITKEIKKTNESHQTDQYLDLMSFTQIYQPQKGDLVVGIIKLKSADYYIVDIGAPLDGTLGALQFDGATKRNKPNIAQGSLIYCRVTEYNKYLGAKLSCINKGFNSKNELGQLKGGIKIFAPKFKHHLVQKKLETIAKYIKFQIAFGRNNTIWVKTANNTAVIALYNVIQQLLAGCSPELMVKILQTVK